MREYKQLQTQAALETSIHEKLEQLYGRETANRVFERLRKLLLSAPAAPAKELALSEQDAVLIAYGDHVQRTTEAPLATLFNLLQQLKLPLSALHILPFYPYSSDDGFSVIDYYAV